MKLTRLEKRQIIEKLNSEYFKYGGLSALCTKTGNNPDAAEKIISKIIKYGFTKEDFLFFSHGLFGIISAYDALDARYAEYLAENRQGFFSFLFKRIELDTDIVLDDDIRLEELDGIMLPKKSDLEAICKTNIIIEKENEDLRKKREQQLNAKKGFLETAFTYTRSDFIRITDDFTYECDGLTGKIYEDLKSLYNGERYGGDREKLSPLRNPFEKNLEEIRTHNDISLRKIGDVYGFINGRHRMLYLLNEGEDVEIPVSIERRIENREFNICLRDIIDKYSAEVYKNNILNDEPSILIHIGNRLYPVTSMEELRAFDVEKSEFLDCKNIVSQNGQRITLRRTYRKMILEKYLEQGEGLLTQDFIDFAKGMEIDSCLIAEYQNIQSEMQKAKVFRRDYRDCAQYECTMLSRNNKNDMIIE